MGSAYAEAATAAVWLRQVHGIVPPEETERLFALPPDETDVPDALAAAGVITAKSPC